MSGSQLNILHPCYYCYIENFIFFNYSGINGYHICFKASELGGKSGDSSEDETECSLYW